MPSEGQPWDPALFGFLRGSLQMAQALRDAPGETLTRGVFRRAHQMAIQMNKMGSEWKGTSQEDIQIVHNPYISAIR